MSTLTFTVEQIILTISSNLRHESSFYNEHLEIVTCSLEEIWK
jgi:hypothetical protein